MVRLKKPSLGNKILYEIAIGIVAVILLLGVLNTITHTEKVVIVDSNDLNKTIRVSWAIYNATTNEFIRCANTDYNLSDIATLYNGYLYISIPLPELNANETAKFNYIWIAENVTWSDLVNRGFNSYYVEFQIINDTALPNTNDMFGLGLAYHVGSKDSWMNYLPVLFEGTFKDYVNASDGSTTTATYKGDIDTGNLLLDQVAKGYGNSKVYIQFDPAIILTPDQIQGIKIKYELYVTSKKPILKMFTEPAYGIIAGLWSTLVAVYHRIRQYALSFFGGFSVSALFTGLIGDPTTALIITAAVVAVFFFALARPAPRRRHD